jgi:hypothetical protein
MPHQDSRGRWISDDGTQYWDGRTWVARRRSGCGACMTGCLVALAATLAVLVVAGFVVWNNPDFQRYYHRGANQYQAIRYDQVVADHGTALEADASQFANCDQQDIGCRHAKAQAVLNDIKSFRAALDGTALPGCLKAADGHLRIALDDYQAFFKVAAAETSVEDEAAVAGRLQDGTSEMGPALSGIAAGSNCTGTS